MSFRLERHRTPEQHIAAIRQGLAEADAKRREEVRRRLSSQPEPEPLGNMNEAEWRAWCAEQEIRE